MPQIFVETGRSTDYLPWCLGKTWPSPGGSTLLQKWKKSEFHNMLERHQTKKSCRPFLNVARAHIWSLWIVVENCGIHCKNNVESTNQQKYLPILKFIMNTRGKHWENLKSFTQISHICFFCCTWEMRERIPNTCATLVVEGLKINLSEFFFFTFTPCVAKAQTRYSSIPLRPPRKETFKLLR